MLSWVYAHTTFRVGSLGGTFRSCFMNKRRNEKKKKRKKKKRKRKRKRRKRE